MLINNLGKLSWEVLGHVTKMLQAENGQKLTSLNRYTSVNIDIDGI